MKENNRVDTTLSDIPLNSTKIHLENLNGLDNITALAKLQLRSLCINNCNNLTDLTIF